MGTVKNRLETEVGILVRVRKKTNKIVSEVVNFMETVGKDLPFREPEIKESQLIPGGTDIFFPLDLSDQELEYTTDNDDHFEHLEKIGQVDADLYERQLKIIVANFEGMIFPEKEIHSVMHTFHIISTISV